MEGSGLKGHGPGDSDGIGWEGLGRRWQMSRGVYQCAKLSQKSIEFGKCYKNNS